MKEHLNYLRAMETKWLASPKIGLSLVITTELEALRVTITGERSRHTFSIIFERFGLAAV